MAESFFATVKTELVHRHTMADPQGHHQRDLRLHRGLVQHPPAPLRPRPPQPRTVRIHHHGHGRTGSLTTSHRPCPSKPVNPKDRQKESWDRRSAIYLDYLTAARALASTSDEVTQSIGDVTNARTRYATARFADGSGSGDAEARALAKAEYDAARKNATIVANANEVADREYDKQSDLVYVYGSEDALHSREELTAVLRPKVYDARSPIADSEQFWTGAQRFLVVLCREASATPRESCS